MVVLNVKILKRNQIALLLDGETNVTLFTQLGLPKHGLLKVNYIFLQV